MAKTTGLGLIELATAFNNLKPDIVLTIADRYETIATAIAGSYMNIPVAHVQGGEVTGSIDEKVRHAVTKLSNLHFVSNQTAYNRVIKMGEEPNTVFITGCPSIDIAARVLEKPDLPIDPIKQYGGVGSKVDLTNGYYVVMHHPVTTEYRMAREQVTEVLKAVNEINKPILWFWPNVDAGSDGTSKGIRAFRENVENNNIWFFKNFSPMDFLKLLYNSNGIIGNSSVAIRECSFLGVPAVNIGTRQMGRTRGKNVTDIGYNHSEIKSAILHNLKGVQTTGENIYGDGASGEKIASLLAEQEYKIDKILTY
jgi:UDP-hydrolysing UDP-N-acetyl-D-glucosamine 2-epimerase